MPTQTNWLRLPGMQADPYELVHDEHGRIIEVKVACRTTGKPVLPRLPCCLGPMLMRNGTKAIQVRDRRIEAAPTWLVIQRQRFKCKTCGRTTYEVLPEVDDAHAITKRLSSAIALSAVKRPFSDAAQVHAVDNDLVRRIFHAYAKEKLAGYEVATPRVLGVDENNILGGFRFVAMDIEHGKLLEMLTKRDVDVVSAFLDRLRHPQDVEVFCQDMWRGYASAARRLLPRAIVVIDRFHVVKIVNEAMTDARVAYQNSLPNAAMKGVKKKNKLFLARWEKMKPEAQDHLAKAVKDHPFLGDAYGYKERFCDLYELESRTRAEAAYAKIRDGMPMELRTFFKPALTMMKNWSKLIFNYYEARYTSGPVERMNLSINQLSSAGYGYDFETLRSKALLKYGNIIPLGDLVNFDLMSVPPDEREALLNTPVIHGINLSTLERALKRGNF